MAYQLSIIPQDVITVSSGSFAATTAGTSILIPSTATGAIYITSLFANAGTASTVQIGYGLAAVAPTSTSIVIQPIYLAATASLFNPLIQPIKIPASNNVLCTWVGGSVASAGATFFVAP